MLQLPGYLRSQARKRVYSGAWHDLRHLFMRNQSPLAIVKSSSLSETHCLRSLKPHLAHRQHSGLQSLTRSPVVPVYSLSAISLPGGGSQHTNKKRILKSTHHRPLKLLTILPQLFQSIRLISRPLNQLARLLSPNIFQNRPHLVFCRCIFSHIKLEFRSLHLILVRVICSLVLCRCLGSMGANLLKKSMDADGSWERGLMEEGYYIPTLLLFKAISLVDWTVAEAERHHVQIETSCEPYP